ncbi:ThiF family adenylyltransferase [Pseudogemmobacter faecipullorum]|uniref:ThiF family adenylyltransferase n=1 Tax=Pseudogemmobacter faecipullorum TaxID=2755041 RepID=A0ABS8CPB7_9RHOB|nr:ThiF family adenylyltransferase [Pseudogemmobacter faecipullorum]MCB5411228.1 ThiF family adenylyltransferase [Pseudogemmobacter faecipullorum]
MKTLADVDIPDVLHLVTSLLRNGIGPVSALVGWNEWRKGFFSLPLTVNVAPLPGQSFPADSGWHLIVSSGSYPADVFILPDRATGPGMTFPHQGAVSAGTGKDPWLFGEPCLTDPTAILGDSYGAAPEPVDLSSRLIWKVERFSRWCELAAAGCLHRPGDHFEFPPLSGVSDHVTIGFYETEADLARWTQASTKSGVVRLVSVSSAGKAFAAQCWRTLEDKLIHAPDWGALIGSPSVGEIPAIWFLLDDIPIIGAWQLPRTYRELGDILAAAGIDLAENFAILGQSMRKRNISQPAVIMFGFPVPRYFGAAPSRVHWLAISDVRLTRKNSARQGFRPTEENRQRFDRELALSGKLLAWAKCENWAPDQIRTRLRIAPTAQPKVLLLGAGALGGHVAETLTRMGVSRIDVRDGDVLAAGNLCRHSLDLGMVGVKKASALAARLNRIQPDAQARGIDKSFPMMGYDGLETADDYEVILDCTAENKLLRGLSMIPWKSEKLFISLSVNWGAQGLMFWSSRGSAFPAIDATTRLEALARRFRPEKLEERIEGIGCWHPVFPADAADIQVWAGMGARFVLNQIAGAPEACGIYFFNEDRTIGLEHG